MRNNGREKGLLNLVNIHRSGCLPAEMCARGGLWKTSLKSCNFYAEHMWVQNLHTSLKYLGSFRTRSGKKTRNCYSYDSFFL